MFYIVCSQPWLDGSAHLGNGLLYRHGVLKEPFPSFTAFNSPTDYCHRYILRAINCHLKPVNSTHYMQSWDKINDACGIEVFHITHNPRVQGQQEMMDKGCSGK
jgi:hypothetical protein